MRLHMGACIIAASTLGTACVTPGNSVPAAAIPPTPSAWVNPNGSMREAPVAGEWWKAFADSNLTALVDEALLNNSDISVARSRVEEATALTRVTGGALLPSVAAVIGAQSSRDLNPLGHPDEAVSGSGGLRVSYEADFWGRVGSLDRAQQLSLAATRASRDTVRLSVATATARLYFSLISLDVQASIARDTISTREASLNVIARRVASGYASQLEQSQAEAELAATRQRGAIIASAIDRTEASLNLLCGRAPGPIARAAGFSELTLPDIPVAAPSTVVERRPDIAQAEYQLSALDANYAAARAALFPQVRLTAAIDRVDSEALPSAATLWSFGGSVLAPVFDRPRLEGQMSAAEARRNAAAYSYRGVVLAAFAEVETALGNARLVQIQLQATLDQQSALRRTLGHARNRYEAGYVSYLEQIDAQRGLLAADLAVAQIDEARFAAAVDLVRATGGGWPSNNRVRIDNPADWRPGILPSIPIEWTPIMVCRSEWEQQRSALTSHNPTWLLALGLALALASGCVTQSRQPWPETGPSARAELTGFPGQLRIVSPKNSTFQTEFARRLREARAASTDGRLDILALSGGGAGGAFGAGALVGQTDGGARRDYEIVTGVSTGALIAPFAFLGSSWDAELEKGYTSGQSANVATSLGLGALFHVGVFDEKELRALIEANVSQRLLDAVAERARTGRALFVATTNLDTEEAVYWDMGAIAQLPSPRARQLFVDILVASASIPGAFSPVVIPVHDGPRAYDEMHVDGGITVPFFIAPELALIPQEAMPELDGAAVYVIVNGQMSSHPSQTQANTLAMVLRSFNLTMIRMSQTMLLVVSSFARRNNMEVHFAYIPSVYPYAGSLDFSEPAMRGLFDFARDCMARGQFWIDGESVLKQTESVPAPTTCPAESPNGRTAN